MAVGITRCAPTGEYEALRSVWSAVGCETQFRVGDHGCGNPWADWSELDDLGKEPACALVLGDESVNAGHFIFSNVDCAGVKDYFQPRTQRPEVVRQIASIFMTGMS